MKIIKSFHTAAVTALAAHLLNKPIRMVVQMERTMEFIGKRFPVYTDYEVSNGRNQFLSINIVLWNLIFFFCLILSSRLELMKMELFNT